MVVIKAREMGLASLLLLSSCAHTTKEKVFQNMLVAGAAGVLVGQAENSYKTTHSLMYGGVSSAVAAAVTLYFEDPDREVQKLRDEVNLLKGKADEFERGKVVGTSDGMFGAKVPAKYKALVRPGEWKVFAIDQWQEDGENRLIHLDKVMELIPPSLNPGAKGL